MPDPAREVWLPAAPPNAAKAKAEAQRFEPPAAAHLFPQGSAWTTSMKLRDHADPPSVETTDFNPWTGNHPEDSLTEQTVKTGFQNKPLVTNELNNAKVSLWSHITKKGCLQNLSQLFVSVLEKRQTHLRLTTPYTFKPPPRVTLTNTKREAWLQDLANPTFALRRLNRTIPYGISGKVLLEQCVNKDIPIARAVWLAKCIGANELRTLKRKGVTGTPGISGELKWVREWTVHVEQFVDITIASFGEELWKEKMQYVMRLIFHLFVEQLLDHEHFLEWLLSAFEASTVERLPMWLVHLQLYWKYLVSSRKRGKRLAECLFRHLESTSKDKDADLLDSVLHRMRLLVATLAVSHRGCMILPKVWNQYEHQLRTLGTRPEFAAAQTAIETVITRNERLAPPSQHSAHTLAFSPRRKAFEILDGVGIDISVDHLTSQCLEQFDTMEDFLPVVLQWASSIYREGSHRVYIVTRILRRCKALGADIEAAVLTFLTEMPHASDVDETYISRIVAELVRSKQFAVGRLLQSLISTGRLDSAEQDSLVCSSEIQTLPGASLTIVQTARRLVNLLLDIPTHDLPQHVADLRRILLHSAGIPDIHESQKVDRLYQNIAEQIDATPDLESRTFLDFTDQFHSWTLSDKFALSFRLRQKFMDMTKNNSSYPSKIGDLKQQVGWTSVLRTFLFVRNILECLEDVAILADVVGICFASGNTDTLSSLVDTLHYHHRCLAAIGAFKPLLEQVIERYQSLRNEAPLERSFVHSLLDLCTATQADENLLQQLVYDLGNCEQRNTIAMCSPASDNAADILTSSSMDSDDEIERILSSGTTMDEQSLARVFKRLVARLEEGCDTPTKPLLCGKWFSRLRSFDESTFDGVTREWLSSTTFMSNPRLYSQVLPTLIGSECLSFNIFAQIVDDCKHLLDINDYAARVALELGILEALLLPVSSQSPAAITVSD
jgi:mediator of RNA polymerase II transcription subunit 12